MLWRSRDNFAFIWDTNIESVVTFYIKCCLEWHLMCANADLCHNQWTIATPPPPATTTKTVLSRFNIIVNGCDLWIRRVTEFSKFEYARQGMWTRTEFYGETMNITLSYVRIFCALTMCHCRCNSPLLPMELELYGVWSAFDSKTGSVLSSTKHTHTQNGCLWRGTCAWKIPWYWIVKKTCTS